MLVLLYGAEVCTAASRKQLEIRVKAAQDVGGGHPTKRAVVWHESLTGADQMDLDQVLQVATQTVTQAKGEYIDTCANKLHEAPMRPVVVACSSTV